MLQLGDGFGAGGFGGVGDGEECGGAAVDGGDDRRVPAHLGFGLRGLECVGERDAPVGEERRTAGDDGASVDDAFDTESLTVVERLDGWGSAEALGGGIGDGACDGVLGGVFDRADEAQCVVGVDAVCGSHGDEGHASGSHGAGLVEDDGVDATGGFEDLGSLDDDAELGGTSGADEQSGGRGEAECAGTGDNEHAYCCGEGSATAVAAGKPEDKRGGGQADDDRNEDGGDAVGQALHRGLAGLCFFDEAGHLGEGGVGPHASGAHDEASADVEGCTSHGVAWGDFDGDALASEQRGVDGGAAGLDDAVGGDLLARPDDEAHSGGEGADGDESFGAVGVEDGCFFRPEGEQCPECGARLAFGALLEVAAGEEEDDDGRCNFEVEVLGRGVALQRELEAHLHAGHAGVAEEQGVERPGVGRERANGDEGVHRGRGVAGVAPRGDVERPSTPDDDR